MKPRKLQQRRRKYKKEPKGNFRNKNTVTEIKSMVNKGQRKTIVVRKIKQQKLL